MDSRSNRHDRICFIHISAFGRHARRRPEINQLVAYTLSSDKKGRPRAENATLDGYKSQKENNRQQIKEKQYKEILAIITSGVFLIIVGLSVLLGAISPLILGLYIIASLFTFIMYAHDKTAARENSWRVREKTLQLLSLMGGWPGALIAQQKLHHKSRKLSFQIVFWLTIILNCCAFIYLFTPNKTTKLRIFIEQQASKRKIIKKTTNKTKRNDAYGHIHVYDSKGNETQTIEWK